MRKLIGLPALVIVGPQALIVAFMGMARFIMDGPLSPGLREVVVFFSALALLGSTFGAGVLLFDSNGLIEQHADEQRRLREKRERELAAIEAEIGIPHIGGTRG